MGKDQEPSQVSDGDNVLNFETEKERLQREIENGTYNVDKELFSDEALLEKMNERHAFICSYGGKPAISSYVYSEVFNKKILEFISPEALALRYSNQSVMVGKNPVELGKWWLKNTFRREYETVIFDPSKPKEHEECLNLWEGFSIESKKGNWKYTLAHIYRVLCNRNKEKFNYIVKWFAWTIQNPADRAEVSIIFKGKKGAGKGFLLTQFVKIFGDHGLAISDRNHLTGQFNGHLARVVFLFADEAYYPGDKEVGGVMKQLITEPMIPYNEKHRSIYLGVNRLHIGMATNEDWVIPATNDERRYFVNEVDNCYAKGECDELLRNLYFSRLFAEMDNGGREAMLYDLKNMDLGKWHPRFNVPDTEELVRQKKLTMNVLDAAIFNMLDDGSFPGEDVNGEYIISSKDLCEYIENIEPAAKRFSNNKRMEAFKKLGATKKRKATGVFWVFPELNIIQQNWERVYTKHNWQTQKWYIQRTPY